MGLHSSVKLRHSFEKQYPGTWTTQGVGAQAEPYRRGWYPQLPVLAGGSALAFCRVKKWLYVGGAFTTVAGASIPRLFRMSLENGVVDPDFNLELNGAVNALATDGEDLYVGGAFTNVLSTGLNYAVKLDVKGDLQTGWLPAPDAAVTVLAFRTGALKVYVAGSFAACGGEARSLLAEVSSTDGLATAFNAGAFSGSAVVRALAYSLSDDALYIGGTFTTVNGGTARTNAAKLAGSTGTAAAWAPNPDNTVNAVVVAYPLVYIGGSFANAGGSARGGVAAINQAGTAATWDVSALVLTPNALSFNSTKGILFAGGPSQALGLDVAVSGAASQVWNANPSDTVNTVLAYKATVFLGGAFATVNGIGATSVSNAKAASVPFPLFRDTDTIFISKSTGIISDQGMGTYADPKRSLAGALRTTPSLTSQSGGADLTEVGFVPLQMEGWTRPHQSNYMAGPFSDNDYFTLAATIGTAWQASNELTVQFAVWIESLSAINTIWDWENSTGEVVLSVGTSGQVNFNIHGTTASSANGVIQEKQWYTITAEKSTTGNTKRVWVTEPGGAAVLVIDTTQAATLGNNTSHRLGRDRVNAGRPLVGFMSQAYFFSAAEATGATLPFTWQNRHNIGTIVGAYAFQTAPVLEGDPALRYLCILDSETYEEALNLNSVGYSIYANDGCSPIIRPRVGAAPGTYGSRPGREFNFDGIGGATGTVSKSGNDSTGTLGSSALPFLTVQAAITATIAGGGGNVVILDSGVYAENINGTGGELVIGAAAGETPIIQQSGSGTFITGPFYFSGLILRGNRQASGASRTYAPGAAGSELWWQDCTFDNIYLALAGASQVYRLENCSMSGYTSGTGGGVSFTGTGTATVRNCYFGNDAVVHMNGNRSYVDRCTVKTSIGLAGWAFRGCLQTANDVAPKTTYMTYCLAETNGGTQYAYWMGRGYGGASSDNKCYNIYGCRAVCNAPGIGFLYQATGTIVRDEDIGVGGTDQNFLRNFANFASCLTEATVGSVTGFDTVCVIYSVFNPSVANPWMAIINCVALGTAYGAFSRATMSVLGSVAGTIAKIQNFSAPDSTTYGVWSFDQEASYQFTALASNVLFASTSQTATFSTGTAVTSLTGTGVQTLAPGFLSIAAGDANAGLAASSVCLFNGDTFKNTDQGASWAWCHNQAPGATFNGLTFDGPINMGAGLENVSGVETNAEFCTFTNLGVVGYLMRDGASAYACEAAETNGPGFRIGGVSASVTRSIAWGCAGTGFLYGAPDLLDEHNSSWGCERGHSDASGSVGTFTDSIHSANGVDAVANEQVVYSAVGTVGTDTELAASSTQADPLFVEPADGDLSLRAAERGYPYTSPAKGTGTDGDDMGAYESEYGQLHEPLVELDFNQASTISGAGSWTNPDTVDEELVPILLAEGSKPLGGTYSTAQNYKRRWTLGWNPNNPMPQDQLIALDEAFRATGRAQLVLDGTCYDVTVLRSNSFQYTEIGGDFVNPDNPKPLRSLTLQEI